MEESGAGQDDVTSFVSSREPFFVFEVHVDGEDSRIIFGVVVDVF
jgi:hypothetical protein